VPIAIVSYVVGVIANPHDVKSVDIKHSSSFYVDIMFSKSNLQRRVIYHSTLDDVTASSIMTLGIITVVQFLTVGPKGPRQLDCIPVTSVLFYLMLDVCISLTVCCPICRGCFIECNLIFAKTLNFSKRCSRGVCLVTKHRLIWYRLPRFF